MSARTRAKFSKGDALVLFAPETLDAPLAWALIDGGTGEIKTRGESGDGAPLPAAAPEETALILPGADAQVKRLVLPARTDAQARAAAPMLFEGAIAADEGVHYALGGAQDAAGTRLVAAIAHERMEAWLGRCRALGAEPHLVALDFTVWPTAPGVLEVHEADTRTIVAGGAWGGFSIEPALAASLTSRWLARMSSPMRDIRVSGGDAARWRAALGVAGADVTERANVDAMAELARGVAQLPVHAPNLRQGGFAPKAKTATPLNLWRFAAVLAVLALLLQVASNVAVGFYYQRAAKNELVQAENDLRAKRPELGRIRNLRVELRGMVNAEQQAGMHPVIEVNDALLQALERNPAVRLDELRHEAPGQAVRVQASAAQAGSLDAFAAELEGLGVHINSRVTQPQFGRYSLDLTLESP